MRSCKYKGSVSGIIALEAHAQWNRGVVDISKHKGLQSPFAPPPKITLSVSTIAEQVNEQRAVSGDVTGVGMVAAMRAALTLDDNRNELQKEIATCQGTAKDRTALAIRMNDFRRDRQACQEEFEKWIEPAVRRACNAFKDEVLPPTFPKRDPRDDASIGVLCNPAATAPGLAKQKRKNESRTRKALNAKADELAEPDVALPSAHHSKIRRHPEMKQAVEPELALREGQADEALEELRLHTATFESLEKRKRQGSVQHRAKDRYRSVRDFMLVLGLPNDHSKFRVLADEDLRASTLTTVEQ
ncbi:hypothetical protein BD309DRAFT_1023232 [Dichomitus squalens]|uniref:Uncharacterized protein n=1 Tax=Dichomitus squalens TaxID=114155 RepID=A0A4Q9NAQ4_9APHY|nr:hypothetical protein BD309DRAFT_1023232 [Dichomitus squalens]TBU51374.1 hypothetical protein BD310DRAFT_982671 [Dichomitus squalens]